VSGGHNARLTVYKDPVYSIVPGNAVNLLATSGGNMVFWYRPDCTK